MKLFIARVRRTRNHRSSSENSPALDNISNPTDTNMKSSLCMDIVRFINRVEMRVGHFHRVYSKYNRTPVPTCNSDTELLVFTLPSIYTFENIWIFVPFFNLFLFSRISSKINQSQKIRINIREFKISKIFFLYIPIVCSAYNL